ncbi:hypothetical protein AcidC75_22050 [Acidisoma sp. C75]
MLGGAHDAYASHSTRAREPPAGAGPVILKRTLGYRSASADMGGKRDCQVPSVGTQIPDI